MFMNITFIQSGGTIDKNYPTRAGSYAFEIGEPAVTEILEIVKPNFSYKILSALKKDSLDITNFDREKIFKTVLNLKFRKIIVTHGTDTILKTAERLAVIKNKVIILTGARVPYKFRDSDAMFNIGVAVGAINQLDFGVYVAMSGRVYFWNECQKEVNSGVFFQTNENYIAKSVN